MIVIISPEESVAEESAFVNAFFENGLDFYHVRKYEFSDEQMKVYLTDVDEDFRNQIVLHSHDHLAKEFGISRLHFREEDRIKKRYSAYKDYKRSTSVHRIDDFNTLTEDWQYAFLSPVFPSISKLGYGKKHTVLNDLKQKHNPKVKLIGLGGIQVENIQQILDYGVDGVALLGSIWQSPDPLHTFLLCKKSVQSY